MTVRPNQSALLLLTLKQNSGYEKLAKYKFKDIN